MQAVSEEGKENRRKGLIIKLIIPCFILLAIVVGALVYINDFYHANTDALRAMSGTSNGVSIRIGTVVDSNDIIVYEPQNAKTGLIFYPGAKVAYEAYTPLMKACAEQGILCIIVKMPANLAILGSNRADGLQEAYPEIEHWYIGGHSLGGAMASTYLSSHTDEYEGLILLASYSTKDLSQSGIKTLSIYGSEDQVINKANYEKYKVNLGTSLTELVIDGGCHAYFGSYGPQDGDGQPTITPEEQRSQTVEAITDFVLE